MPDQRTQDEQLGPNNQPSGSDSDRYDHIEAREDPDAIPFDPKGTGGPADPESRADAVPTDKDLPVMRTDKKSPDDRAANRLARDIENEQT